MATEQMSMQRLQGGGVELGEFVPFVTSQETRSLVGRTAAVLEMIDGVLEKHDDLLRMITVEDIAAAAKANTTQPESLPQPKFVPHDQLPSGGNAWDDKTYIHPHLREMDGAIGTNYWSQVA